MKCGWHRTSFLAPDCSEECGALDPQNGDEHQHAQDGMGSLLVLLTFWPTDNIKRLLVGMIQDGGDARPYSVRVPDIPDHEKRDQLLKVYVFGFIQQAHAYLVKDCDDGQLLLMPIPAFVNGTPQEMPLSTEDIAEFTYRIQSETQFTFGPGIFDENGGVLTETKAAAIVLHHLLDADQRYYVVRLPDHDERDGYRNWWAAFDVCVEDRLG